MKHIKIILLVFFIASTALSCATRKKCALKHPCPLEVSKDSIYIEIIKKVPYIIQGDSIVVEVPINCPDQELVSIETGKLKQQISILNGKLQSYTEILPDTITVTVKETETIIKTVKVKEPVRYVPQIIKIFAWLGGLFIIAFIIWLVLKFFK